jgi:uncharacterized protein (TIGR02147 family)
MPVDSAKSRRLQLLEATGRTPVFDHLGFRDYLAELYKQLKAELTSYSYKKYAEDLGLSYSNVIWLYLTNRRQISLKTGQKIIKTLGLKHDSRLYAERLIKLETITKHERREAIFKELFDIKTRTSKKSAQHKLEFYSEWYFPVIRELLALSPEQDVKALQNKLLFRLFPKQIEQAIDVLLELGLIKFDKRTRKYQLTSQQVGLDYETGRIAAARFHQKICELTSEAVVQVMPEHRELNTMTLSLAEEDIPQIRQIILRCCEEIFAFEQRAEGKDRVFQFNIQFFPLTTKLDP